MKVNQRVKNGISSLWHSRITALIAAVTMLLTATAATEHAAALYILTGAEETAIILDRSADAPKIESPMINISTGSRTAEIYLSPKHPVVIRRDGELLRTTSKRESVTDLLKRMGASPSPLEMVAVDIAGQRVEVTVGEEIICYDRVTAPAAYETVRRENPELPAGTEKVVQAGQDGVTTSIYEVVWSGGRQISRQLVEEVGSTAVNEIVEYGTAAAGQEPVSRVETNPDGSGTLHFASGATLEFSAAKSMTATAYTAGHGGADYTTATGTFVRIGTVAVDKKVIPLGTRMYIVTDDGYVYGLSTAEDTGVRGNKVDLYFETYRDCINFGRRGCTVYILK